ncbi:MAG: DUF262 domain-containing protein [Alphaproteobacteria bacterium]
MKSDTITVQQFFKDRRQFCVPFYQRPYVWTMEEQWEQLWEDIQEKAEARLLSKKVVPHFLGAVVLDPQTRDGLMGVDKLHIIDGQQRLTTLQFVLHSLLIALKKAGQTGFLQFVAECTQNPNPNPDTMLDPSIETFKVWPTFRDRTNFKRAVQAESLDDLRAGFPTHFTQNNTLRKIDIDHPPALAALWYFTREFSKWLGEDVENIPMRVQALIQAILSDFKMVSIILEADDDAQVIFETLNGRGAQLHATDLIRNYVFMRADRDGEDSAELYNTLWSQYETEYWAVDQRRGRLRRPRIEWLMHTSLQAELRDEVDLGRLYYEYRRFAMRDVANSAKNQLKTLDSYAQHYKELIGGSGGSPIGVFGRRIADMDITTVHPLALLISISDISQDAKREMFGDIVSYLMRRAVCGLTQKNYNNVFLNIIRQMQGDNLSPLGLRKLLGGLYSDASRWPTDAEFYSACLSADLYPGRLEAPKVRTLLTEIEGALRSVVHTEERSLPSLAGLDIDHILPQSWFRHWPLADGSAATSEEADAIRFLPPTEEKTERQRLILARQSAVPTLGNLTLLNLSVNRQAQNHAFQSKRDLIIANTSLRLNIPLISMQSWDEAAITARAETLSKQALKIWPGPRA